MEFNLDRMVVAADNNPTEVSDAISALRQTLLNPESPLSVFPDGTISPDPAPSTPADTAPLTPASDELGAQPNTFAAPEGFKAVPKATVAAPETDSSVRDAISSLRETLTNGEVYVNQDGTVFNPGTAATNSSIANGESFKPVPKATVAALQWYQTNPSLQRMEIAAMHDIQPGARYGFLPNGKMYWQIQIHPVNVKGERHDWTLLAVYDEDHPQQRWGGSVKFYPVCPNYQEMMQMVNRSYVTPKTIPHLLRDDDGQMYMCSQDRNRVEAGHNTGDRVYTAATGLRLAMRWINVFELGILDQQTWTLFHDDGKI